jgi:hypothetical protein
MKTKLKHIMIVLAFLVGFHRAAAQETTAFTYQGQLRDGGTNANGAYTLVFKLYDAASGGNQIGAAVTNSPILVNGLFRVCSTICGFLTNRIWVVSLMRVQAAGDVASGQALGPGFWPVGLAWGAAGPRMRKWRGPRSIGAVRSGCWTAVPGQSTAPAAHARATHPLGAIG